MIKASLLLMLLFPVSLSPAQSVSGLSHEDEPADSKLAASMSLDQARQEVHRWRQWILPKDDAGAHVLEFAPSHLLQITRSSDGTERTGLGCPYDSFQPFIAAKMDTFQAGPHQGESAYRVYTAAPNTNSSCMSVSIVVPDLNHARRAAAAFLRWKMATPEERTNVSADAMKAFAPVIAAYHAQNPRPELPEGVRRFRVIAEGAVTDKRFGDAVAAYEDGLAIAPWWPAGHFNTALVLGELRYYDEAILHMQQYLALVPDAPDARAAQDRIYQWQGAQQAQGHNASSLPIEKKKSAKKK